MLAKRELSEFAKFIMCNCALLFAKLSLHNNTYISRETAHIEMILETSLEYGRVNHKLYPRTKSEVLGILCLYFLYLCWQV